MRRISSKGQDLFAAGYHHKYSESVSYRFVSKGNGYLILNHLYYYTPRNPNARIIIKASDTIRKYLYGIKRRGNDRAVRQIIPTITSKR